MSRQLISRSEDLSRLQADGYEIDIEANHLVVRHVPYLAQEREVKFGVLMCPLVLQNDRTGTPDNHVMMFAGEKPFDSDGVQLKIVASEGHTQVTETLSYEFQLSRKPKREVERYVDYYEMAATYAEFLGKHARAVDPAATARTYLHVPTDDEPSVFRYADNASTRAEIQLFTDTLKSAGPVAIVGLGGTGAYILDLVAKTPVEEIHLYDGDRFSQHNAFRSPGAPAGTDLDGAPPKVVYLHAIYDRMHSGIRPHHEFIDEDNVDQLTAMAFVFIAVDDGTARRLIVEHLTAVGVPFIDVGMGIYQNEGSLGGQARVTTSTPEAGDAIHRRLPITDPGPANEYRTNIQIADINALNATLAVIKWKKLAGFYQDLEDEHHSVYVIGGNRLVNEDHHEST